MSEHVWKIGDWCEYAGKRRVVVNVTESGIWASGKDPYDPRDAMSPSADDPLLKHLPDCDSWDWQPPKPIEPPDGYRLLGDDETVKNGDWRFVGEGRCFSGWFPSSYFDGTVREQLDMFRSHGVLAYARKIEPQYRPFANAAEFSPYRDNWIQGAEDTPNHRFKVTAFNDIALWTGGCRNSYKDAFELFKFEDGTPFGVKV